MKNIFTIVIFIFLLFTEKLYGQYPLALTDTIDYKKVYKTGLIASAGEDLTAFNAYTISSAMISANLAQAAQMYSRLLTDSLYPSVPLEDRFHTTYITNPVSGDTLYAIDLRIYSPAGVGRRYNRMLIIRPYDTEIRPCILYTHGNSGNLNSWNNYYMIGIPAMVQRGYVVAVYENFNNSFFTNALAGNDEVYKNWVHQHLEDSLVAEPADHLLQRGHYLLYQYAYAAHSYLSHLADTYKIDKTALLAAGHSAGGLSTMMLSFGDPETNFRHQIFEKAGAPKSRVFSSIVNADCIPIKGVLCSAAGLPDVNVPGSYYGTFLGEQDSDKTVLMIHGVKDVLAPVDYGPALWATPADTVKMMGPVSLHPALHEKGIRNFVFLNCLGEHGVYMYPYTVQDQGGTFTHLSPLSYDPGILRDPDFLQDEKLRQLVLYQQQMDQIMGYVAEVMAAVAAKQPIYNSSAVYSWATNAYEIPVTSSTGNWNFIPAECGIPGAKTELFEWEESIPTKVSGKDKKPLLRIFPNPAQDVLIVQAGVEIRQIMVTDLLGRVQIRKNIPGGYLELKPDDLPAGIYLLTGLDEYSTPVRTEKLILCR